MQSNVVKNGDAIGRTDSTDGKSRVEEDQDSGTGNAAAVGYRIGGLRGRVLGTLSARARPPSITGGA